MLTDHQTRTTVQHLLHRHLGGLTQLTYQTYHQSKPKSLCSGCIGAKRRGRRDGSLKLRLPLVYPPELQLLRPQLVVISLTLTWFVAEPQPTCGLNGFFVSRALSYDLLFAFCLISPPLSLFLFLSLSLFVSFTIVVNFYFLLKQSMGDQQTCVVRFESYVYTRHKVSRLMLW
jgi:hypothetical protein